MILIFESNNILFTEIKFTVKEGIYNTFNRSKFVVNWMPPYSLTWKVCPFEIATMCIPSFFFWDLWKNFYCLWRAWSTLIYYAMFFNIWTNVFIIFFFLHFCMIWKIVYRYCKKVNHFSCKKRSVCINIFISC